MRTVLAIDLGASSGRGILFSVADGKFESREVHRFPNGAVETADGLFWDVDKLFAEIKTAIKKGAETARLDGVGIDTWGVDYGFVGKDGKLLRPVRNYRDARTAGAIGKCGISPEETYAIGGIAPNEINTAYQLWTERGTHVKGSGEKMLMMPQLFGAMLCGEYATEPTIASTTGFFRGSGFDIGFAGKIGLSEDVFPEVKPTGSILGYVKDGILKEIGVDYPVPVITCAGHDTACAVLSIPADDEEPLFLSSGTWSLFGAELKEPIINEKAFAAGYSNESGYGGTVRFLKNIMGLWILQECRKQWQEEGQNLSFVELTDLASAEKSSRAYIDVSSDEFRRPGKMADKVRGFAERTQKKQLNGIGSVVRCILESLALEYRVSYDELCRITGKTYSRLYIIGGGSRNKLLNQLTADALGLTVFAGPAEGTAMGNAAAQLISLGELSDKADARRTVAATCQPMKFEPIDNSEFSEESYRIYLSLKN